MKKIQIVKTVSYDLIAEVEVADDVTPYYLILDIERDGDAWIDWEQPSGNNEVLNAYEIEDEDL